MSTDSQNQRGYESDRRIYITRSHTNHGHRKTTIIHLQAQHQQRDLDLLTAQPNKPYTHSSTDRNPLLLFQSKTHITTITLVRAKGKPLVSRLKCNLRQITAMEELLLLLLVPMALAEGDLLLLQDHLHLLLLQLAQIQHYGHYLRLLIKMVRVFLPLSIACSNNLPRQRSAHRKGTRRSARQRRLVLLRSSHSEDDDPDVRQRPLWLDRI